MLLKPGLLRIVPLIGGDQAWVAGFDGSGKISINSGSNKDMWPLSHLLP